MYTHTERVAFPILSACSLRFICLNIINDDNRRAVGLAKPLPNETKKRLLGPTRISSTLPTGNIGRRAMDRLKNGSILISSPG